MCVLYLEMKCAVLISWLLIGLLSRIYRECIERYMHYFVKLYSLIEWMHGAQMVALNMQVSFFHKGHSLLNCIICRYPLVLNCIILVHTFCTFIWLIMYIYLIFWSNCIKLCDRFVFGMKCSNSGWPFRSLLCSRSNWRINIWQHMILLDRLVCLYQS
jgi:hypothetical protein